jgi:uncharacterized membrane protein
MKIKALSNTTRSLFLASCVAVVLDIARVGLSQKINFIFLVWNLTLAWISYTLATFVRVDLSKRKFIMIFLPWLLFFPNAAYLVTDILHVDNRPPIPLWYDSVIFFIFAWLGIMLASLGLLRMHRYVEKRYNKITGILFVVSTALVSAFGIYLGRFERWNSWDVLRSPMPLLQNIVDIWVDLPRTTEPLYFTAVFGAVILTTYYVVREVVKDVEVGEE